MIDPAFIKNFEAEVHIQYQKMGSKLRNTVRMKDNISSASTTFTPVRGTPVSLYAAPKPVECPLSDYYAGDWIDRLEDLETNISEQQIVAKSCAYALGRKSDELITDAMMGTELLVHPEDGIGDTIDVANALLDHSGTPDDGQRFAVVGWNQWGELLNIQEFANADYLDGDELPWKGTQAKRWLGTIWILHSGLPKTGNVRSCFWYHKTAVGHAIGTEVKTDVTWHDDGDCAAHFVNNRMAQGACLIDPSRVVRMQCVER